MGEVKYWPAIGLIFLIAVTIARPVQAECDSTSGQAIAGTVVGAVLGGILGSKIGSGSGQKVAIGVGAIAGGFLGNRFGASLDCEDQVRHHETAQQSLETQQSGTPTTWQNPDSGDYGTVTPVRTYQRDDGVYCREFEQSITVNGTTENDVGHACRQEDATWTVIDVAENTAQPLN